jgi:hypothetical protein
MTRASFNVHCSCGEPIEVTAAHAGSEVACRCGRTVPVPSLSELRRSAGQSGYAAGIADRIRQKFADGRLPIETACVECGRETADTLVCFVECERSWASGPGCWKKFFTLLSAIVVAPCTMIWAVLALLWFFKDDRPEVQGTELVVEAPLRMCGECQDRMQKSPGTRELTDLLRRAPLYHELLREYPRAAVVVGRSRTAAATSGNR